jgi:tRNA synthetases class I (W and Y)
LWYSVKTRLDSDEGLDAASFLYQSLQAYDFVHLYQTRKCTLQIGGSDQWGNILAGIDLLHSISPPDSNRTRMPFFCKHLFTCSHSIWINCTFIIIPLRRKIWKNSRKRHLLRPQSDASIRSVSIFPSYLRRSCRAVFEHLHASTSRKDRGNHAGTCESA